MNLKNDYVDQHVFFFQVEWRNVRVPHQIVIADGLFDQQSICSFILLLFSFPSNGE